MTHVIKSLCAAFFIVSTIIFSSATAENSVEFDNPRTSITGQLVQLISDGSTNHVLLLDEPITIEGNPASIKRTNKKTVRNIQRVTVVFSSRGPNGDALGNFFTLTGRLHNESSDPRIVSILMSVESFVVIKELDGAKPVVIIESHS